MPAVITASQRWKLARMFERAKQLALSQPPDFRGAHAVLAECCTIDPGNTLFLEALLENLERAKGKTACDWPWQVWSRRSEFRRARSEGDHLGALRHGWMLLGQTPRDHKLLREIAELSYQFGHGQSQVLLLQAALRIAPEDTLQLPFLAIALGEQGQFALAAKTWREWLRHSPGDKNAMQFIQLFETGEEDSPVPMQGDLAARIMYLLEHCRWAAAERLLTTESGAEGNDLRLREFGEEISLRRAAAKTEMAERQSKLTGTLRAQQLVSEIQDEQRRVELGVAFARYERFPAEPTKSWELAECLSRVGNFSEALKYLSPLHDQSGWRVRALIATGENWQQLRQFDQALVCYRQAIDTAEKSPTDESGMKAWYRGAVLAEAMGLLTEAVDWFERLTAADPAYKDAAARLVKLRAVCDKGGFSARDVAASTQAADEQSA